jgi:hypothetical protein
MVVLRLLIGISLYVEQILFHLLGLLNWINKFFRFIINSLHKPPLSVYQILNIRETLFFTGGQFTLYFISPLDLIFVTLLLLFFLTDIIQQVARLLNSTFSSFGEVKL